MNIINKIEQEQLKADVTPFNVGDTIKVHTRVIEGGKERIQIFQGIVIAKRGSGTLSSFASVIRMYLGPALIGEKELFSLL